VGQHSVRRGQMVKGEQTGRRRDGQEIAELGGMRCPLDIEDGVLGGRLCGDVNAIRQANG